MGTVSEGVSQTRPAPARAKPTVALLFFVSHVGLGLVFGLLGILLAFLGVGAGSVILGIVLLGIGTGSILTGYGFFRLRRWLLRGGILTSYGYLAAGVLMIVTSDLLIKAIGAIAIIQAVGTLGYLRMKGSRALLNS
jgi:hypothetical protein